MHPHLPSPHHRGRRRPLGAARAALVLALWTLAALAAGQERIALEPVASGFERPLGVVAAGDALYVLEQTGRVRVVRDGRVEDQPFLDLRDRVSRGGERGLLGLAFAPAGDAVPSEVFVHLTDPSGDTLLLRMPVVEGRAVVEQAREMLRLEQPYGNHNGGQLAIGPDGMLYLGLGDGGSAGDPLRAGQDLTTWLGKILRLDPVGDPYAIPSDNPFAAGGGEPEIWVSGLRNPWRFSFDAATGDLWIADVGQNETEEIDRLAPDEAAGADLGWSTLEGDRCFRSADCDRSGTVAPVAVYRHADGLGRSVTGGYVYRGDGVPDLTGRYVFGDFVGGTILAIDADAGQDGPVAPTLLARAGFAISSFGVDGDGELLVLDYQGGRLLRIVTP
jgi:glucose/arabinose dehydrogenase